MKTSLIIAALLGATTLPTWAAAETYFSCGQTTTEGSTISLGTITAEADGIVEVYEYRFGEPGAMLGEAKLNAGANSNVRITAALPIRRDVVAMVKIGGETVATKVFDVCDR